MPKTPRSTAAHMRSAVPFLPLFGDDRRPQSLFDWATVLLADVLLKPGLNGTLLYDRAIAAARPRAGQNPEPLDPLLQAMGWTQGDIPDLQGHMFASTMGSVFERFVHTLFAHSRPALYSTDWASLAHGQPAKPGQGKRYADLMLGNSAIELKYRYGSGQSADDQGRCAQRLRDVGKTPVMLSLRTSPKSATMASQGWVVHEGPQAIAYIEHTTGVHLGRLAEACLHHPLFKAHRAPRMSRWRDRRTAEVEAAMLALPVHEIQASLARLQQALATQAAA